MPQPLVLLLLVAAFVNATSATAVVMIRVNFAEITRPVLRVFPPIVRLLLLWNSLVPVCVVSDSLLFSAGLLDSLYLLVNGLVTILANFAVCVLQHRPVFNFVDVGALSAFEFAFRDDRLFVFRYQNDGRLALVLLGFSRLLLFFFFFFEGLVLREFFRRLGVLLRC